jgi:hypothetical protein
VIRRFLISCFFAAALAQPQSIRVGEIDFYGYAGLDPDAIRKSLPVREGETATQDQMPNLIDSLKQAARTSHVNAVCCDDKGGLMIYIGLPGKSARTAPYNPVPMGTARLPQTITHLDRHYLDAQMKAIQSGAAGEDHSRGYALSSDPAVREDQLAMRRFATGQERVIRRVLESSSDAGQRAIAARLMGYARQSQEQIAALVRASHDPDDDVRNNAMRALWVLAQSNPNRAARIPAAEFAEILFSDSWTDRNKASLLLDALTQSRNPEVLREVCAAAREPLLEMAQWRSAGHAASARSILGRCAGIPEDRLQSLVTAGDPAPILKAYLRRK